MNNAWPKLRQVDVSGDESPIEIVNSFAKSLKSKTKGLLFGLVTSVKNLDNKNNDYITVAFHVMSPKLGSYSYRLFQVEHNPVLLYPCKLTFYNQKKDYPDIIDDVANSKKLTEEIYQKLDSEDYMLIITALLNSAKSVR